MEGKKQTKKTRLLDFFKWKHTCMQNRDPSGFVCAATSHAVSLLWRLWSLHTCSPKLHSDSEWMDGTPDETRKRIWFSVSEFILYFLENQPHQNIQLINSSVDISFEATVLSCCFTSFEQGEQRGWDVESVSTCLSIQIDICSGVVRH